MTTNNCQCGGTVASWDVHACSGYRLSYNDEMVHFWFIECRLCHMVGGGSESVRGAIENWNRANPKMAGESGSGTL